MSTALYHTRYTTAAIAGRVLDGLDAYADIVRRPMLKEEDFEPSRDLSIQALEGLDDDPRSRVLILLRQFHWPSPYNRNTMGEIEHLKALTLDECRSAFRQRYAPQKAILSLAGDVDPAEAKQRVEAAFGDWRVEPLPDVTAVAPREAYHFSHQDSEQTHIGIACATTPETHDDYYVARVASEILSGGMSGRLFTEIREKRGLCYSVGTSYSPLRDRASLLGYAGSSNERAQATLDAFIAELKRLSEGVTADEVDRAKVGLRASTIMSGESSPARAGAIASDYFTRGRLRSLNEIEQQIAAVTVDRVNDYVRKTPLGPFTIVIVGPKELKVDVNVLA
ncbi:MAG: pitrilysin family protein [Tepidisphaeraceae bacterium]